MLDDWDQKFHFTLTHHQTAIIKVEAFDSYIKRSMGTMVIMKVKNITWLA
jgi:hypothetical protein